MANIKVKGLIIRQSDYGQGHRMLTVFTDEYGIIKAVSYGARRTRSTQSAASQFLCYGDFELYKGGGEIFSVNRIDSIENFYPIHEDLAKLSLCTYFAEITCAILDYGNPDANVLRLLLNMLYACAYKNIPLCTLKLVYELRLMALGGYMPEVRTCIRCGTVDSIEAFDLAAGGVLCRRCGGGSQVLNPEALGVLRYILSCPDKKILAFKASEPALKQLGALSEAYLKIHLDKPFASLAYLHAVLQ